MSHVISARTLIETNLLQHGVPDPDLRCMTACSGSEPQRHQPDAAWRDEPLPELHGDVPQVVVRA